MINITILIPVYNEEETILPILKKISELKKKTALEIIIINDGSTDNTKKILEENSNLYNKAIHLETNLGKGKAIIEGLNISSKDFIFFQDADLEYDPKDIKEFINLVELYEADLVMGSRFTSNKRSVLHFWHMLGNKFITLIFNLLNDTTFTDIYCCHCLFKRDHLDSSNLKSYGWGQHAEILTYLVKNSKKIYETSVNYNARKYSQGKKIRYYNVFEVLYWILRTKIKILF